MKPDAMHETKLHGKPDFPYTVYRGKLPEYIRSYPLHWHEEMELITVASGCGVVTVQARRYEVRAGDLLLIQPQLIHGMEQLGNAPMEYFNILFRLSLLGGGLEDACYERYLKPLDEGTKRAPVYAAQGEPLNRLLRPYIDDLTENRRARYDAHALMVRSDLLAIAYHLQPYLQAVPDAERVRHSSDEKLKKVLLYVRENYAEPVTVGQAAQLCGFSASHFRQLFRERMGVSFIQYVKAFRLERAADRLRQTEQSVTEIAQASGFANQSYFTRAFAAKYGVTPSAYRKSR